MVLSSDRGGGVVQLERQLLATLLQIDESQLHTVVATAVDDTAVLEHRNANNGLLAGGIFVFHLPYELFCWGSHSLYQIIVAAADKEVVRCEIDDGNAGVVGMALLVRTAGSCQ